jgi:hypothetical protein
MIPLSGNLREYSLLWIFVPGTNPLDVHTAIKDLPARLVKGSGRPCETADLSHASFVYTDEGNFLVGCDPEKKHPHECCERLQAQGRAARPLTDDERLFYRRLIFTYQERKKDHKATRAA